VLSDKHAQCAAVTFTLMWDAMQLSLTIVWNVLQLSHSKSYEVLCRCHSQSYGMFCSCRTQSHMERYAAVNHNRMECFAAVALTVAGAATAAAVAVNLTRKSARLNLMPGRQTRFKLLPTDSVPGTPNAGEPCQCQADPVQVSLLSGRHSKCS